MLLFFVPVGVDWPMDKGEKNGNDRIASPEKCIKLGLILTVNDNPTSSICNVCFSLVFSATCRNQPFITGIFVRAL